MAKKKKGPVVEDIYAKLAELLSESTFKTSAEMIGAFEKEYPEDWQRIVEEYGHRDDSPGKERGHFYASSTYVADRLSQMKRMGLVELKYTLDFDHAIWRHNKRMGSWRLIKKPEGDRGLFRFITFRTPASTHERLASMAVAKKISVATLVAEVVGDAVRGSTL